jgi:hypothetical protein
MQSLLEAAVVLFLLLLLLRVSLVRRRDDLKLRGGLSALNVITGALAGGESAFVLGDRVAVLAALWVLPIAGVVLGGLFGYYALGALWRHYFRSGPARARSWLRNAQFLVCAVAIVLLARRLLG